MKFEELNFDGILACVLAHSVVYFCKDWHSPLGIVDDARCEDLFGGSSSQSSEASEEFQVAGQGGGAGSNNPTIIGGSSSAGTGASGSTMTGSSALIRGNVAAGATVNIETPDVNALAANQNVSETALAAETQTTHDALTAIDQVAVGAEQVAADSISSGVSETNANTAFGEAALQTAADAQSTETTALEQEAASFAAAASQLGTNALAAAQNEILAGVSPGQTYETGTTSASGQSSSTISTIAAWLSIAGALVAVIYFLNKKKAA